MGSSAARSASSSASFTTGVLSTLAISCVVVLSTTTSGAGGGGVGVHSIFRRFGSTISPSSSSSSPRACLRPDAGEDDDGGDESGPGLVAGVGVRGQGSVAGVGAGAGVTDVGEDAEDARAEGDSVCATIGGVVEAVGGILHDAAPHVHFSTNCHGRIYIYALARKAPRMERTCVISASFRSRCTRILRSA